MSPLRITHTDRPRATYLALLAMVLVLIGQLVGQLCAYGEPARTGDHAMGMEASVAAEHPSPAQSWHIQCGYCSLLLHVPILDGVVVELGHTHQGMGSMPVAALRAAHGDPGLFPHALTRAPPIAVL
ncbi:DUF2946 family protein [Halomonas sp. HP20-15]|uniref:DUF2946 family protein n=1 Tax=Halomonas sp. HP20-15 TaxID=3085901 RepID=UPI002981AEE1|nr:DUF2946 family protein [Halomonas sp. HP20-15]MDW5376426.1 DUF2946 family protein [Halomonas sp. HP20-15]